MKKHFILLILLIFCSLSVNAQKNKDALYLKNGSVIYGKLLEIANDNYKILTSDGSMFNFKSEEVDKFIKLNMVTGERKQNGLGLTLESGLLIGAQNSNFDAPFSFNFLVNYTIATTNMFGIGSGVEFLGSSFSPVFIEYRKLFSERKTTPFIYFRGGALIHMGDDNNDNPDSYPQYYQPTNYKGGFSLTAGTGISWMKEGYEICLSFAYRYARTSYEENAYNNVNFTYLNNYNRLELKLGFRF
jgi:hypothetical protein